MANLSPIAYRPNAAEVNALFRRFGFSPNGGFALRDSKGSSKVQHQVRNGMALGLQALENPDIHCATACRRQLPIVQNSLGKSPALDSQSSKVFDRCMT
jgi:hypothetical protein